MHPISISFAPRDRSSVNRANASYEPLGHRRSGGDSSASRAAGGGASKALVTGLMPNRMSSTATRRITPALMSVPVCRSTISRNEGAGTGSRSLPESTKSTTLSIASGPALSPKEAASAARLTRTATESPLMT